MPNNKNQDMDQKRQPQKSDENIQGGKGDMNQGRQQQSGNFGGNKDLDSDREVQGNVGGQRQGGNKGSTNIEREDGGQVSNDNDLDRDLDTEQGEVPQRSVQRDQGQQQGQIDRNKDRNK